MRGDVRAAMDTAEIGTLREINVIGPLPQIQASSCPSTPFVEPLAPLGVRQNCPAVFAIYRGLAAERARLLVPAAHIAILSAIILNGDKNRRFIRFCLWRMTPNYSMCHRKDLRRGILL
jgi:hypothetical protein